MSSTAGTPLIAIAPQAPDEGGEKRSGIAVAMLRDQGGDSITRHLWFMATHHIYGRDKCVANNHHMFSTNQIAPRILKTYVSKSHYFQKCHAF